MAREFDKALCDYFRVKFGPFKVTRTTKNRKVDVPFDGLEERRLLKCDFCGEPDTAELTELAPVALISADPGKRLYVCTCGALQYLVPPEDAAQVALKSLLQGVGMSKSVMGGEEPDPETAHEMAAAADVMKAIEEVHKPKKTEPVTLSEIVKTVKVQMALGKGTHWKILPDLMRQYDSRGTLSLKQRAVLVKFLASIKE